MRALVIDDSKPVRSILRRMLGELGFDVAVACHGEEGFARLAEGPRPDVVTVNWNMPVMDGLSFLVRLRKDLGFAKMPVIMVSMETNAEKIAEAKRTGADAFLVKPVAKDKLEQCLKTLGVIGVVGKSTPVPPPSRVSSRLRRVMIVDDSVVIRRTLTKVLDEAPDIEVAATAADGRIALQSLARSVPDVVLLDVEMPNLNGLETLKELRKLYPKLPVIMFSALTERGAAVTLEALMLGADDYVPKPTEVSNFGVAQQCIRDELLPRIRDLASRADRHSVRTAGQLSTTLPRRHPQRVEIVVIGVSTGGPMALAKLLPQFAPNCPVPIVIVQHMPPVFTRHLAERLTQPGSFSVVEGDANSELKNGQVVIAPGCHHLVLARRRDRLVIGLNQDPPEHSCRPAVDVLFRSAAEICRGGTLGVVLTGMGKDGLRGSEAIVAAGGAVLCQDEASSVVWGMPCHVVQAGLAEAVVSLDKLGSAISKRLAVRRS